MDRDLGALDAVSEAMEVLQERFSEQDFIPSEVFAGAWMVLHGAVRAAEKRREHERADDRIPDAPSKGGAR
ncbi:hypothetical protein FJV41_39205 [Myxococcus llanfairpwllgwyngyllgogerychwyrndrobwllllantysiliogogogochensis]|uniref:Uncharacterized protein n=1 Tax=Myxococcus llanfairpwllgwyngyllgogerychwyrndrobwllllantysiliogogogochensis TaxID=2590453 RepID=A0A540WN94_9BACT|nr:hypothetical protein [Myxococcus llanfairpwllgwyngyllgogerychwyrndrobwllllantysiliogogogochensis]TQF10493.1 hypothetical protein FJV41_39205 [Myxococcus llanfairpwllgwyngyllgogerychwyrndrobwllllantysiliogogogochensis]